MEKESEDGDPHRDINREREKTIIMHGWMLNFIQLAGLLISDTMQLKKN